MLCYVQVMCRTHIFYQFSDTPDSSVDRKLLIGLQSTIFILHYCPQLVVTLVEVNFKQETIPLTLRSNTDHSTTSFSCKTRPFQGEEGRGE